MTDPGGSSRSTLDAAFRTVFQAEFGYVWNSLRRLGVREADLPDLTHDVFVTFHRRQADYDPARPLRPWLFGIAYRVASDHRRLARNRNEKLLEVPEPPDSSPGQEAHVAARQARELVLQALEAVAEERRPVLVLHELEGLGMPEIAEALGIPLNTGYSRLRLARAEFAAEVRRLRGERGAP